MIEPKMLKDFFDHVMSVMASHDTDGIINRTTAFVSSRCLK